MIAITLKQEMADNGIDWGALIGGAAGAKALDVIANYIKLKRETKNSASKGIIDITKIYATLQAIPTHQCQRRTVFKAHNSGGNVNTRTHTKVSILYEDPHEPFKPIMADIQGWHMDDSYAKMLAEVCRNGSCELVIDEMDKSRLKDLYVSDGVKYSLVIYIGEDKKNIYYASFASSFSIRQYDSTTISHIKNAIDKIKPLLKF